MARPHHPRQRPRSPALADGARDRLSGCFHQIQAGYTGSDRTGIGTAVNGDTVYVTELFSANLGLTTSPQGQQGAGRVRDKRTVSAYPDPATAKSAPSAKRVVRLRGAIGGAAADGR